MLRRCWIVLLLPVVFTFGTAPAQTEIDNFAFVQFSDIHTSPHLIRTGEPAAARGAESIAWICEEAVGPQDVTPLGITTPAPAFAIATGDLTEYGVIDDTWAQFEKAFEKLPYQIYVTPGNHDNTWVPMYDVMRERHGGANYSFNEFGCHFICLSSASPAEPVPTIDQTARRWLARDLHAVPRGTPIFVALHHPPYSNEFAPAEQDTFIDMLRHHNVVLMLYGHGHHAGHRNMDGIDGAMGGTTYDENAGYSVISVQDGMLRVAHRYQTPNKDKQGCDDSGWKVLLEKPLTKDTPQRLFTSGAITPRGDAIDLELRMLEGHADAKLKDVEIRLDGEPREIEALPDRPNPTWRVQTGELIRGFHLFAVRATTTDGLFDLHTATYCNARDQARWEWPFFGAIKAAPTLIGNQLVVASTEGQVRAINRDPRGKRYLWTVTTGGEVLGTPARSENALVFGSGDGKVYALDDAGKIIWTYEAGRPVYGAPLIDADAVYIGDNGGRLHCLNLADGQPRWTFERADFAIECKPCVWGELVVFGAWDGYLYALNRADGTLAWKSLGPKSSESKAARYYAPADCGPVALGDTLFVCDRGYVLAAYDREGKLGRKLDEATSAIAADPTGEYLYARCNDDRLCKFDASGEKVWEQAVPAGRFPIPPTCAGDMVYVCSNTGRLSVLDAAEGTVRWSYQATPGFYVMAPVIVDETGACYVSGMNGTVTAVSPPAR